MANRSEQAAAGGLKRTENSADLAGGCESVVREFRKRRDLLKIMPLTPLAMFAASGPGKLPSGVFGAAQAKVTQEPFGELRVYQEGPTEQLKSMTAGSLKLKPGMSPHPPHQHEEEEYMVITEGTGEISVEGKITKVGPGSMMYAGSNRIHGIVNTGKTPLLFYYYKWKA